MHCTSRPKNPPTRSAALRLCWLAVACCIWLIGCAGGSGSSGFDLQLREDRAIDEALASNDCEINEGLTICAAGGAPMMTPTANSVETQTPTPPLAAGTATPTPSADGTRSPTAHVETTATATTTPPRATETPTATPTMTMIPAAPQVDTNITPGDIASCVEASPGGPCLFEFSFAPLGFPASSTYLVAIRAIDASGSGDWDILPAPIDNGVSFIVVIPLDPAAQYQTAVLVFEQPPGALPETVQRLAETGADFAFVSASFGVVSSGI